MTGRPAGATAAALVGILAGAPVLAEETAAPTSDLAAALDPATILRRQEPDLPIYLSQPGYPGTLPRRGGGFQVGDGPIVLDLGMTSRYVGRVSQLTSDQDFYQYVHVGLRPAPLGAPSGGGPTVSGSFLFRVATDLDGEPRNPHGPGGPDPFRDILNAEIGSGNVASRVFTGYLEATDLLPGTQVRLGRQYLFHTGAYQMDGGEITVRLGERGMAYAYGGRPVSYFVDQGGSVLAGAGSRLRPWPRTSLALEYTHVETSNGTDNLVTLAGEQQLARGITASTRFRELGSDPWDATLGLSGPIHPLGLLARLRYRQVLSDVRGDTYPIAPLSAVLGPERRLANVLLELTRPLTARADATAGAQVQRITGQERYASRDYARIFARLDLLELPWRGAFISPSIENWMVGNDSTTGLGIRWTQVVSPTLETWMGTDYARYFYDYLRQEERENVRLYYVGTLWRPRPGIELALDFQTEQNNIPTGEDPLFTIRAWVTIAIP